MRKAPRSLPASSRARDNLQRDSTETDFELSIRLDVIDRVALSHFSIDYESSIFPTVPTIGDSVGLPGVALTGVVVQRTVFPKHITLQIQVNLDGRPWTMSETIAALIELGYTQAAHR